MQWKNQSCSLLQLKAQFAICAREVNWPCSRGGSEPLYCVLRLG